MHKLLANMLNITDELFSFVDTNYCYQEVNHAYLKLFSKSREDFIGKHVSTLMGDLEFKEIKVFLDRCFSGEQISYDKWFEFPSKERFYLLVTYTPYFSDISVAGAIVSVKNYTQQKQLEEERQQNKELLIHYAKMAELGSMASFINHQWRAPLNTLGANFLNLKALCEDENASTAIHQAIDRCEEILQQISDDLEIFRDIYNPNTSVEIIHLDESIKQVLVFLDERIRKLDVAIGIKGNNLCKIYGKKNDFLHLLMIFFNNTLDAFEYRQTSNPFLNITLKQYSGHIVLIIEDNAGGIEDSILEKLFSELVSSKSTKQGSGMGLFFAKMIAYEKFRATLNLKNSKCGLQIVLKLPK